MKKKFLLGTFAILIAGFNVYSQPNCKVQFSFDSSPIDTFGASYGDVAYSTVLTESGIDVKIDSMLWFNGSLGYNYVQIQEADCGFGFDQRAWFNNASLIFDLNSITTDGLSFIFWDNGGDENLQVNGSTWHVISDFKNLPLLVAPNVLCFVDSIYADDCHGGEIGRVNLIGNVNELRIAGQELAIDSLCINERTKVTIPDDFECQTQVSFDIEPTGSFGASNGDVVGDVIFSESGIDIKIDSMLWVNNTRGYHSIIIQPVDCGVGFDQRVWFNNASLVFDISSIETKGVSFIYADYGGEENLQVNGSTEFVLADFKGLPSVVAPGVTCVVDSVYADNCNGTEVGRVTLLGNINELRIAGQELVVDSLCIDEVSSIAVKEIAQGSKQLFSQNHPNPFSQSTIISYTIPEAGKVSLKVYDMLGREIQELVNEYQTSNQYAVNFNAESMPTGIYYYKLQVNDFATIQKMVLVK